MRASDAKRVDRLVDALNGLKRLRTKAKRLEPKPNDGDWRALELQTTDICEEGGTSDADIQIPIDLAEPILDQAEMTICAELKRLGVDPDT